MKYLLTNQETKRLKFRLLDENDFEIWKELFTAENVGKFLDMDPNLTPRQMCEIWFKKSLKRYEDKTGGMNVMIDKQSNQLIGQCGLLIQNIDNEERLEIGYSVLPKFWNNGYAFEAALKCKEFAFKNNLANSLISMVHFENIGSEKVAKKNGMSLEKRSGDYNIFSIKKKDWF
ncbi:GNAT family N-acetyltransferase [Brumimicrobium mesophilum]|uniref:GNAT family N-acetyltransferase n=1 Tax=Brumimicrobium mesophilum TaxID=392717 RepID=UPI000D140BC8|nr:GNAT family N-acetyltransferase [Brumimicrobium mesophilum]